MVLLTFALLKRIFYSRSWLLGQTSILGWSRSATENHNIRDSAEIDCAGLKGRTNHLCDSNHILVALGLHHLHTARGGSDTENLVELIARNAIHNASVAVLLGEGDTDTASCIGEESASNLTDGFGVGVESDDFNGLVHFRFSFLVVLSFMPILYQMVGRLSI